MAWNSKVIMTVSIIQNCEVSNLQVPLRYVCQLLDWCSLDALTASSRGPWCHHSPLTQAGYRLDWNKAYWLCWYGLHTFLAACQIQSPRVLQHNQHFLHAAGAFCKYAMLHTPVNSRCCNQPIVSGCMQVPKLGMHQWCNSPGQSITSVAVTRSVLATHM